MVQFVMLHSASSLTSLVNQVQAAAKANLLAPTHFLFLHSGSQKAKPLCIEKKRYSPMKIAIKIDRRDFEWILTCFGTAVGAGILFLPIQAGIAGIWPMMILTLFIFPITYIAHRGITRIVASCHTPTDITGALEHDMGRNVGFAVSVLYFLSIITICVSYATGITNIVESFLTHQMKIDGISRPLLTFALLVSLTSVVLGSEKLLIRVTSALTYPLIFFFLGLSIYMIPYWNLAAFQAPILGTDTIKNLLLLFPVLVFAMNFSPICSTLGSAYRRHYPEGNEAVRRTDRIIKWNSLLLLIFVMFFVFSIVLATTPEILAQAKAKNIDVLTMISIEAHQPFLKYLIPGIAFLAIASSYFGHFIGTREGLAGITTRLMTWSSPHKQLNHKKINLIITIIMIILLWLLAVYNPPILKIISALSAPIIAIYCYLMPVFLMKRLPRLLIYRSRLAGFVFVMGLIGILGDFVGSYL
jgi:serine transporter